MGLPDVTLNIQDGSLGIIPNLGNNTSVKFGISPLGIVNTIYSASDLTTLQSLLGPGGPLVEASGYALAVANGGTLYCVPCLPSTAGALSAVTKSGVGAGTLTVAARAFQTLMLKVVTGGAVATATFQTSYDGGATYRDLQTTAATIALTYAPSITIAFTGATGGSFVSGDVWTVSTTSNTATLSGTGTGTVAVSVASPVDIYTAQVTILGTGALGVGTFKYSLDNQATFSGTLLIPASGLYAIPNTGVLLTFTSASFTAGDTFTFTTTAPTYSSTDLTNAWNALVADPRTWRFAHVVGPAASVGASATLLASLDTLLAAAASNYRFAWVALEVPVDTDANTIAAFVSSSSTRVMACAGTAKMTSVMNGRVQPRSSAWAITARVQGSVNAAIDPGKTADGPVAGIVSLVRDEQATPGLDAQRFATLRTIIGLAGFWVTNGNMMAPVGSDFSLVQYRQVMDIACAATRLRFVSKYLNAGVRVNKTTGFILESEAQAIEKDVAGYAQAQVTQPSPPLASDLAVAINRATNIISTRNLSVTVRVTPLAYLKTITENIGFNNPALTLS